MSPDTSILREKLSKSAAHTDTGIGMDKDTVRHAFDKFYESGTSHSTKGDGIGSSLVRKVVVSCVEAISR